MTRLTKMTNGGGERLRLETVVENERWRIFFHVDLMIFLSLWVRIVGGFGGGQRFCVYFACLFSKKCEKRKEILILSDHVLQGRTEEHEEHVTLVILKII